MKKQLPNFINIFLKPVWKIWAWGLILFTIVFFGVKIVSKIGANLPEKDTNAITNKFNKSIEIFKPTPSDKVYVYDDDNINLPSFPAGEKAFASYVQKSIHYDVKIYGNVIASFVVNKAGSLTNIKILRSVSESADNEVIKVLKNSPKWNPGRMKTSGKAIDVMFSLPINFSK